MKNIEMELKFAIVLTVIAIGTVVAELELVNSSISDIVEPGERRVRSRRKRFLTFPDGSSFQFVFCTQNHGYIQVGDIVWFAITAAMAWELPSDPSLFSAIKTDLRDPSQRRQDVNKHILFVDEAGKVLAKVPYRKKPIVTPALAKRSIQNKDENISIKKQVFIKKMHESQKSRSYLHNLDEASADFHRTGRQSLYKKLETYFEGLGYSGRECILRMLCEVGQADAKQGTFLEEIFRATFTLPKGADLEDELEYDKAHNTVKNCATMYPECDDLRQR